MFNVLLHVHGLSVLKIRRSAYTKRNHKKMFTSLARPLGIQKITPQFTIPFSIHLYIIPPRHWVKKVIMPCFQKRITESAQNVNICHSQPEFKKCQIFCDISKAFDRVWHRCLLYKLKHYGINGNLLMLFED